MKTQRQFFPLPCTLDSVGNVKLNHLPLPADLQPQVPLPSSAEPADLEVSVPLPLPEDLDLQNLQNCYPKPLPKHRRTEELIILLQLSLSLIFGFETMDLESR
jgi:hypothetical protein